MEITRTAAVVDPLFVEAASPRVERGSKPVDGENAQQAQPEPKQAKATQDQVEQAVKDIRKMVSQVSTDLQFSVDKDSGDTVVKVVDSKTKEVIRQIPGDEVIALRKAIDKMKGLLLRQEA